jgi:uncharacterized lipoprotein YmbA
MRRLLMAGSLVLAACLGPRADMSAFYVLSVPPEPTAQDSLPVVLGLGPVTLPGYLDRSQIVIRMSENQVAPMRPGPTTGSPSRSAASRRTRWDRWCSTPPGS